MQSDCPPISSAKPACANSSRWYECASHADRSGSASTPSRQIAPKWRRSCSKRMRNRSRKSILLVRPSRCSWATKSLIKRSISRPIGKGEPFLWPCRQPRLESRSGDLAATSRIEAAEAAMTRYVRVQWKSPAFEMSFRDDHIVDVAPRWPDKSFGELIQIAFDRTGMMINDPRSSGDQNFAGEELTCSLTSISSSADFEFEFGGHEGNPPRPVCMVAKDSPQRNRMAGMAWRVRRHSTVSDRARQPVCCLLRQRGDWLLPCP